MSSELAVQDNNVVALHSPMDMPVEQFKSGLEQRETNRQALLQWISKNLKEDVDYGIIRNKKSLWKPGAEKISGMLGIKREYPNMDQYQLSASEGKELTNIIIKCVLLNSAGIHVSEGLGARTLRQDGGDLNKCIKMAAKSSFIDATLNMCGLSEIFTLDLEDMFPDEAKSKPAPKQESKPKPKPQPDQTKIEVDTTPETRLQDYINNKLTFVNDDGETVIDPGMVSTAKDMVNEVQDLEQLKTKWLSFQKLYNDRVLDQNSWDHVCNIKDLMKLTLK